MPKGFLIKRSKKKTGPVSYRVREEDDLPQATYIHPVMEISQAYGSPSVCHNNFLIRFPTLGRPIFGGMPESIYAPSLSPTRPDNEAYQYPSVDAAHQMLNSTSPAPAETFPEANLGSFSVNGSPAIPSLAEMTTKLGILSGEAKTVAVKRPSSKTKSQIKRRKTSAPPNQEKKPSVRDDVTTSPVLGLRITEEADDEVKQRSNTSSPLGEFVCQLCKERYADPLTLAHHKCSRIVRVEYRCDECDKVFSCPANLASHRRWHKPRGAQTERVSPQGDESRAATPTPTARDASPPSPQLSDSSSDEEIFNCPQCSKKFRRNAYLRKHLALHNRKAVSNPPANNSSTTKVPEQQHNSAPAASAFPAETPETSTHHPGATQHQGATQQQTWDLFPCRFCGDNFSSSPSLTRHINKYHPTESRQVIVLSQNM